MKLLDVARQQIGFKEATGRNDGKDIEKFTGGRQEPWCAHFVAWCFREIGEPLPKDVIPNLQRANPLAAVIFMKKVFDKQGWIVDAPEPGGVIFFGNRTRSDVGPGKHVGIIENVTKTEIITIEGNVGNAVRRMKRSINDKSIWAFGKVKK